MATEQHEINNLLLDRLTSEAIRQAVKAGELAERARIQQLLLDMYKERGDTASLIDIIKRIGD